MRSPDLQNQPLIADFSVNAERRLGLGAGMSIPVQLPKSRMLVLARGGSDEYFQRPSGWTSRLPQNGIP